jgi:hypothetical protein
MYGHFLECDLENNLFRDPGSKYILFFEAREAKYSASAGIWTRLVFNLHIQRKCCTGR